MNLNSLSPPSSSIKAERSIFKRSGVEYHRKQQFLLYDVSSNLKAILRYIDVLCKHRSCVTASLQTFSFSHPEPMRSELFGGKVSSHSKPLLQSNTKRKKLESYEAEIINHLIYGDSAEGGNAKQKLTLRWC